MSSIHELASAKINLSLKVLGRRGDGYHELQSLVVFADIGDRLTLYPDDDFGLEVSGRFGADIEGGNLIERVVELLNAREPGFISGRFYLVKELPVAAGIGGGSSDAAAALRAIRTANPEFSNSHIEWNEIAASIGADVPVCLLGRSSIMEGIGEKVRPVDLPSGLFLLLVNSGLRISTAKIFHALDAGPLANIDQDGAGRFADDIGTFDGLIRHMEMVGNDLEAPVVSMFPEIGAIKSSILNCEACIYSGLSGSGATCFGLFSDKGAAWAACDRLQADHPGWWVAMGKIT